MDIVRKTPLTDTDTRWLKTFAQYILLRRIPGYRELSGRGRSTVGDFTNRLLFGNPVCFEDIPNVGVKTLEEVRQSGVLEYLLDSDKILRLDWEEEDGR